MITGKFRSPLGQPVLFLGLDGENITRLVAGEPVRVPAARLAQLGLPQVPVVIHYGRTAQDILDEIASLGGLLDMGEQGPDAAV